MSALASISQLQLLEIWEELLDAKAGKNNFGGQVCEIYIYRTAMFSPTVISMPESESAREVFELANRALVEICQMFEQRHQVEIKFLNGASAAEIPIADLPKLYTETHRLHIKVVNKS